jgi:hypothetical protein
MVDIGERAWSQLACQFGHELCHVLANSWQPDAKPAAPCQWLEEAIVEVFALRGLCRLAQNWKRCPPFIGDSAYGDAIGDHRQNIVQRYDKLADEQGSAGDFAAWFDGHRSEIGAGGGLSPFAPAAALIILAKTEQMPNSVEAVGALNRWQCRGGVPILDCLHAWGASCIEMQASPILPNHLREIV